MEFNLCPQPALSLCTGGPLAFTWLQSLREGQHHWKPVSAELAVLSGVASAFCLCLFKDKRKEAPGPLHVPTFSSHRPWAREVCCSSFPDNIKACSLAKPWLIYGLERPLWPWETFIYCCHLGETALLSQDVLSEQRVAPIIACPTFHRNLPINNILPVKLGSL